MFVPTNDTLKLANGIIGHAQLFGIILCLSPNCYIIYPVGPVYYCPGHLYNTISSGSLKFYVGFQKFTYEPIEHCDFVDTQVRSWRSPSQNQNNPDYLQIEIYKSKPSKRQFYCCPNCIFTFKTKYLLDYS